MGNGENLEALRQTPLAAEMDEAELQALARVVEIRDCKDGEVLVEEGARDAHLFVPVTGKIDLNRRDEHGAWAVIHTLRPGDLAGELSFMDGEPRFASLVANGTTRVLVLDRDDLEGILTTHPVVVYKAMRAIMRVAHHVQRRMNAQLMDMQRYLFRTGGKY